MDPFLPECSPLAAFKLHKVFSSFLSGQGITDSQVCTGFSCHTNVPLISSPLETIFVKLINYCIASLDINSSWLIKNANGQLILNAQNSVNGKLCKIYNKADGVCARLIGSLEEGQLTIPFDLYVPEDHVSLSEIVQNFV